LAQIIDYMSRTTLSKVALIAGTCHLTILLLFSSACTPNEPDLASPIIITEEQSLITLNSATLGGTIESGRPELITLRGICWGRNPSPELFKQTENTKNGSGAGSFKTELINLDFEKYYVRAYAKTEDQVYYGNEVILDLSSILSTPINLGEVTDIDGNTYKTTTIGNKIWMAENLKVTRYNEGTSIANGSEVEFKTTTEGMYTLYSGDGSNLNKFGYLYNGYTIENNKEVCMTGWHVPTPSEWSDLATSLGGEDTAGGRMKAISNLWTSPNTAADNASGFSALPGGSYCRVCLGNGGTFADKGADAYFWSSSVSDFYYVTNNIAEMRTKSTGKANDGMAIRCVKD